MAIVDAMLSWSVQVTGMSLLDPGKGWEPLGLGWGLTIFGWATGSVVITVSPFSLFRRTCSRCLASAEGSSRPRISAASGSSSSYYSS